MLIISPYLPKVSDNSSCCTNFDKCPTHKVVLHTDKCSFFISGNPFRRLSLSISRCFSRSFSFVRSRDDRRRFLGDLDLERVLLERLRLPYRSLECDLDLRRLCLVGVGDRELDPF